jgi:4-amino-4-deoxy-L-arabinose transferase-like glycosyltransferase
MREGSFVWGRLEKKYRTVDKWIDWVWVILLLAGAVLLFTINLGGLPLRDLDEATVAQVASEIRFAPPGSMSWLYPTLAGEPYHNKPPLMHLLIAGAYLWGGVNEWTTRLPGAILTAISIPLLYFIGREIFYQRICAIYSALIYLTMLPVVSQGRLAMLDGASVCFFLLMTLCVLRSRRDLRYCLGAGIGLGLICLTKGILGILLGGILGIFLFWDTPRLLTNRYMWTGIFIGTVPATWWYVSQWMYYGQDFINIAIVNKSLSPIWFTLKGHKEPAWYYLWEILKYTWPWLLFLIPSLRLTWENRNLSWAKLVLVWSGVYLLAICLIASKFSWYLLPIYPSLALAIGKKVAEYDNLPLLSSYPRPLAAAFAILAVVATAASISFGWGVVPKSDLQLILACFAGTMSLTAILAERGDGQFLKVLFWGSYLSLLLLMKSNYWVGEFNEPYPVKPVAAMIQRANPPVTKIYTSFNKHRPSLDFYSKRTVIPASSAELQNYWQYNSQAYFLLDEFAIQNLQLASVKTLDRAEGWILVTKDTNRL